MHLKIDGVVIGFLLVAPKITSIALETSKVKDKTTVFILVGK